jgi:tetratricopeptide (TPR) repeat protein
MAVLVSILGSPSTLPLVAAVALLLLIAAVLILWLLLGRGPRRWRGYRRAQRLLHQGDWQAALAVVQGLRGTGSLPMVWQERLRNAEGECRHAAGDEALRARRYEDAAHHDEAAAALLGLDPAGLRQTVVEAMLAEARALFAAGSAHDLANAESLLGRTLQVQLSCAEASFWLGLCHVRAGRIDQARADLFAAHEAAGKRALDPPLYLGALLLRQGRPQEALRQLSDANRIDSGCPLVPWQIGAGILTAGGEPRLAVQALQRACGPRGFGVWVGADRPADAGATQRFWTEALPEGRSYVRRLALKHPFTCPVFGGDLAAMRRQALQALALAQYRLGNFQESADIYTQLLQELPPTVPLSRGLGLSLARLGRYDQGYKYLRLAQEQEEEPKDRLTSGYLALCGALGKPPRPEDRPRNVAWAIRLLTRFPAAGDTEWAGLASTVFAEARAVGLPVAAEDQVWLCDLLASVSAADPPAAAAYDHLAATHPEALKPEYAWLYCRAATQHAVTGQCDLALFARTFRDEPAARAFYAERSWDLGEVEYVYLERTALARPGAFPPELGPDYPAQAEGRLLERSRRQEGAGQADRARATTEVLLALAPRSGAAHDRLAQLYYGRGDLDRAAALLAGWHRLEPDNPWPLCRLAVIEQQRGQTEARRQAIDRAIDLTAAPERAAVAYLGARLALQATDAAAEPANGKAPEPSPLPGALPAELGEARRLLEQCVRDNPDHVTALWQLAAVRSLAGDRPALAEQAALMYRPAVEDGRFHYLAAVCHLAADDYPRALEAAGAAARDPALEADSHYLMGWAHLGQNDRASAVRSLEKAAGAADGASVDHARALLGRLHFEAGAFDAAAACWDGVTPQRRHAWRFDETLRSTVFLSGLLAYREGQFEQASAKIREAGRLGLRDRRLGPLLFLSLFRAGQQLLFGANP